MKKTIILIVLMFVFLGSAGLVLAQGTANTGTYNLLTNLPNIGSTYTAGDSNFSDLLNKFFNIGITVAILLSVIMLVIGGVQYMGGDSVTNKSDAKSKFYNAIGGLILALGIYLFLNTINPDLVKLSMKIDTVMVPPVIPGGQSMSLPDVESRLSQIAANESQIRTTLSGGGISINKGACQNYGQAGCTDVGGLNQRAVDGLIQLKNNCSKCTVTVTGGTEWWLHSSGTAHQPGNGVVDLAPDANLNEYLTGKKTPPSSGDTASKDGGSFKYEVAGDNGVSTGAHWHVNF